MPLGLESGNRGHFWIGANALGPTPKYINRTGPKKDLNLRSIPKIKLLRLSQIGWFIAYLILINNNNNDNDIIISIAIITIIDVANVFPFESGPLFK